MKKSIILLLLPFVIAIASAFGLYVNIQESYKNIPKNEVKQFFATYEFTKDLIYMSHALANHDNKDNNINNYVDESGAALLNYPYAFLSTATIVDNEIVASSNISNSMILTQDNIKSADEYFIISYDSYGNISISSSTTSNYPIQLIYRNIINENTYNNNGEMQTITNKSFAFFINNTYSIENIETLISDYYPYGLSYYQNYRNMSFNYVFISIIIATIIALLMPVKKMELWNLYQSILKTPLELIAIISIAVLSTFLSFPYSDMIVDACLFGLLIYTWMIDIFIFKYCIKIGIINYIKTNSISGRIITNLVIFLKEYDFKNNVTSTVIKIVLLNSLSLYILILLFKYIGLLIYSIILFLILLKLISQIKKDYQTMLSTTSSIASMNFENSSDLDLGIFNSYKESITTIQEDFKLAVENEVKSEKMKSELITSVSHDLKTPLTTIVTYVDLLKDNELNNETKKEYIDIIDRNSIRLKNLINDLFDISKASAGTVSLDLVDLDINSLIKQIIFEFEPVLNERGIEIKYSANNEKVILSLDSLKTHRIFTNLFTNINKYALDNTRVYINIEDTDSSTVITLKNITKDEITLKPEQLFERFVQGDSSRHTEGSGLGLAIAKSFTELQHGSCNIEIDGDLFKVTIIFKKTY